MLFEHEKSVWLRLPHMPVTYARAYLSLAEQRGVAAASVLEHAGLRPGLFSDPTSRLSPLDYMNVILSTLALCGDNGLGFEAGQQLPLTAHGNLGYALLSSATPSDAITLLQRFWSLRGRGIRLAVSEQDGMVVFDLRPELTMPPELHRVLLEAMLTGFHHSVQFLLGDGAPPGEIWFDWPEPDYYPRFRAQLPPVRFGMPAIQIRMPGKELLQRRLATANPEALSLAIAQLEREYALFGDGSDDTLARARASMMLDRDGYPDPDRLAEKLHMSPRTFRRKLQLQGSSYKQLLEEARHRDALRLLEKPGLEIRRIAELLGYADPANFTRAFRQWTGQAPRDYRSAHYALQSDPLP